MSEHSLDLVANLVRRRKSNGRCVYDKMAKRELVRRCLLPGVSLAKTALEHGVNANLLRKWVVMQTGTRPPRRRALLPPQATLLAVKTPDAATFNMAMPAAGYLELVVEGGTIRVHGRVDAHALLMAVNCLTRRA